MSNNSSFREMNVFEKILVITALTLLVILPIVGIFFGIAGFFSLFNVQYDSLYSLLLFVLIVFLIGIIFDLFSMAIIKLSSKNIVGKYKLFFTRMVIDCTFSWLALYTADEIMNTITIPLITEIIAVLLLFFVEIALDDNN